MSHALRAVCLVLFLIQAAPASGVPFDCETCQSDIPPLVEFYGGTRWDASSLRWEAIKDSVWTFDTGVGSTINIGSIPNKPFGYHSLMEGWHGVAASGDDFSNLVLVQDLPPPLNFCDCGMQDTVLVFADQLDGHDPNQDSFAVSPWIEIAPADQGLPGRVITFDGYFELFYRNYIYFQIHARWVIGGIASAWVSTGPIKRFAIGECTIAGSPAAYDLSSLIPAAAEEVQIGLGVVNACSQYADCTGISNTSPWFDNIRFGVYGAPVHDSDNDGVTDVVENLAPMAGDGNGDGTPDQSQQRIVSIDDPFGAGDITTFTLPEGALPVGGPAFRCMDRFPNGNYPPLPPNFTATCGVFDFVVAAVPNGEPVAITVKRDPQCIGTKWFGYGPEPGNTSPHWFDFSWNGSTGTIEHAGGMTLTFIDGQRGDLDQSVNGVIEVAGGPAIRMKPVLTGVTDIRNDQGLQVRLKFRGSGLDDPFSNIGILNYEIYRKIDASLTPALPGNGSDELPPPETRPTGAAAEGWDYVQSLPAHGDSIYNVVVPTLADSGSIGPNVATFFVRAATAAPSWFFDSDPDSGYSVDNLSPQSPSQLSGSYFGSATHLSWTGNTEPDLGEYRIYRGTSAGFAPGPSSLVAAVSGTNYADPGPPGGYYKLSAVDVNGNESAFSLLTPEQTSSTPERPLELALTSVLPNPAAGDHLVIRFALPSDEPARFDLIDVAGRRRLALDVNPGAGHHEVDLAAERRITSGIYFIRLIQGSERRTMRVVVVN